jgi:hypothetical protein
MSYREENGQVVLTPTQQIKKSAAISDIDFFYEQWADSLGRKPTSGERIRYWRELFIEQVWRQWPR